MTSTLTPTLTSRLEKAAIDNGFDQELPRQGDWLGYASTQCPLRIWLGASNDANFLAAFSYQNIAHTLGEYGTLLNSPLPTGAASVLSIREFSVMHSLLRRAFQLSRTLPNELLHVFEKETAKLPRSTDAEYLVIQRVGQNIFRRGLIEYWDGRCAVTGLVVQDLLRASHIKPWAVCESDAERLDIFNGFLLSPHLDAAFDAGFITIAEDGLVIISDALPANAWTIFGLDRPMKISKLHNSHERYLPWHRAKIFRR